MMCYCDCCGKNSRVVIILQGVSDCKKYCFKKFDIVTCTKCNHSFIYPMPRDPEEIASFYPQNYYAYTPPIPPHTFKARLKLYVTDLHYGEYSKNEVLRSFQRVLYFLLKHTINEPPIIPNGNLLDIGCGNGQYLNVIRQFGWNTYGIEPSESAVNIARSIGLDVKRGTAENIQYEDNFFDVVRIWNVLEHTIFPRRALSEAARVLKKGAYLIVYVPNFCSIDRKFFGRYWASLEIPRHLHHFSFNSLAFYLEQAGLSIERRLYPGTIFSMMLPTIKILRENQINIFSMTGKTIVLTARKIFKRLRGTCSGDVGICILARKV